MKNPRLSPMQFLFAVLERMLTPFNKSSIIQKEFDPTEVQKMECYVFIEHPGIGYQHLFVCLSEMFGDYYITIKPAPYKNQEEIDSIADEISGDLAGPDYPEMEATRELQKKYSKVFDNYPIKMYRQEPFGVIGSADTDDMLMIIEDMILWGTFNREPKTLQIVEEPEIYGEK